jgi:hypothetical protein
MPSQDGVWFDDVSNFIQRLLTELLAHLGRRAPLSVTELYSAFDPVVQNAIILAHHPVGAASDRFVQPFR